LNHWASTGLWAGYRSLPSSVRAVADKNFKLLKAGPRHPSLHFKRVGKVWSARVGEGYRALAHDVDGGVKRFWIGTHAEYDRILG
jgi:hypothetical protein